MDDLSFSHLTTSEGLSNNIVHCIFQDSKGFIWIGTDDGLDIYDGYGFRQFRHDQSDPESLTGNSVFGIHQDQKGNIWLAVATGVDIYQPETNNFRHVRIIDHLEDEDPYFSYTPVITEDQEGNIIIGNPNSFFRYDEQQDGFVYLIPDEQERNSVILEGIHSVFVDSKNRLWAGMAASGPVLFDLDSERLIQPDSFLRDIDVVGIVWALEEDSEGNIWIGDDEGIIIVSGDLSKAYRLDIFSQLPIENSKRIRYLLPDGDYVWIGTDGGGLLQYHINSGQLKANTFEKNRSSSLNDNSIRCVFKDDQGLLWIGTYRSGVNYSLCDKQKQFGKHRFDREMLPIPNDNVTSLFEDNKGNVWIATDGAGVYCYNPDEDTYIQYASYLEEGKKISGDAVLYVTGDDRGQVWIGGYLMGLNHINTQTGQIKVYMHDPQDPNSLSNDDVRDIFIENDTAVWIATNGGGLNLLNPKTGNFQSFTVNSERALSSDWVLKIFRDSENYLWIGTYFGVTRIDPERLEFTQFISNTDPASLSNPWVYSFAEDRIGNIWVGTANGLNVFDKKAGTFRLEQPKKAFPNPVINGLIFDDHEQLWLSTNKGLVRYNPFNKEYHAYDAYDGLQGDQFLHGSYFKNEEGFLYFGGLQGYNKFHPDSIKHNTVKPNVYLTDLLLFFEEVEIGGKNSPLSKAIMESSKITLRHDQSVLTLKYLGLNYVNSNKNQYAYMLEGLDKDWNYVGSRREATYTNLGPGTYTFRVIASNNDGLWNYDGASLVIEVLPPWWKTLAFRIVVAMALIICLIVFYFYRVRSLKKQQHTLETLVQERTSEIQEMNVILQHQATELGKINSMLGDRNQEVEDQAEWLAEANVLLEERQQQIEEQTEELLAQKEELEHANKHLGELNSTKDKFFSIIAHDLKNPFNTILGFTELLSRNYKVIPEEKKLSYVDIILKATRNIYNLLENLLQWSRSQTNRLRFDPMDLSLDLVADENIALLDETCKKKNLQIVRELEEGMMVYADRNMLNTILRNLLSNAVKFSNPGGTIRLKAFKDAGFTKMSVIDNGIGIPEEKLEGLFRVDSSFSREGTAGETGTGLGLILSKEYISRHKGEIWVESKDNKGCTFSFTLPDKPS